MEYSCPKCNFKLTKCIATGTVSHFCATKLPEKVFTTKETSKLFPYVCSNCGYTVWYVEEPKLFK